MLAAEVLAAVLLGRVSPTGRLPLRLRPFLRRVPELRAAHVVQVYGAAPARAVERVWLEVPLRRLACFDEAADAFVLEGGRHRVVVARHAEGIGIGVDIDLEAAVVGR